MNLFRTVRWTGAIAYGAMVASLGAAPCAMASQWCGDNGLVRFSFAAGDTLVETLTTGEPGGGVTLVEVTAWLTAVEPVARQGDAFLRVGGVEMQLSITGAEADIVGQEFPGEGLNVGQEPGRLALAYKLGRRLHEGRTELVKWSVMFKGRPTNVRFGLNPAALLSCATMPECPESGTQMIYMGSEAANQMDAMFGAGYVPAWLNPEGEPDRSPVVGKFGWREVGAFQER